MSDSNSANQQALRAIAEEAFDPRVDLAVQRTELALERTQLAWIRTAFTFITAGWPSIKLRKQYTKLGCWPARTGCRAATSPARVHRYRRWLLWIVLFAMVPLSLYGWRVIQEHHAKKRLTAILQQIDANDPGWRLDKLQEVYELREVDHELIKTLQPFSRFYGDSSNSSQTFRNPNIRLSSEQLTSLRHRLNATELSTLRKCLQTYPGQPKRRLPDNHRGASRQRMSLRNQFENVMRFTSDELMLALQENRSEDALSLLQSHLALLSLFEGCPDLSTQAQGHQFLMTCSFNVQTMLAQGVFTEDQLARLQRMINVSAKNGYLNALRMVRAEVNDLLERMQTNPVYREECLSTYCDIYSPKTTSWYEQLGRDIKGWFLKYQAADMLKETQAEVLEALEEVIKEVRQDSSKVVMRTTWPVISHVAPIALSDNYSEVYWYANTEAMIRSASVAVACERYRLKTNHWPKSLDELVPQYLDRVPLDPYTGNPLLFKVLPDGAVVYSVGYDLKDDGGMVLPGTPGVLDRGIRLYDPQQRGKHLEVGQ